LLADAFDRDRVPAAQTRRRPSSDRRLRERTKAAFGDRETWGRPVPTSETQPDRAITPTREVKFAAEHDVRAALRSLALNAPQRDVRDGHLPIDDGVEALKVVTRLLGDQ